ncbi:hypothetical protein FVE85_5670 [Porphyridium purpureum]|uniref:Uncharacterized protein n=1 Tax=Porphyridium purpureum TaxID=35688 RepID=A0A5J4Z441_PORPP|nr:hypothetical protein FVE85_5670 [Porphyridium purpureum]|eukprot:POR3599..scf295_1
MSAMAFAVGVSGACGVGAWGTRASRAVGIGADAAARGLASCARSGGAQPARAAVRAAPPRAQADQAASEVSNAVSADAASSKGAQQAPLKRAAVLRNFLLFAFYFVALMGVVGRATMEKSLPHERIILVALAVILPDLARFSFVGMSISPNALRKARNPNNVDAELFPRHYALCTLTTSLKLIGFYLAAFLNVPLGAFVVILGQCVVNGFIQLRLVNGKLFQLRRQDRSGALLMELVMLVMLACVSFNQFPIMMASLFLSMATAYWLGKYDCQLFA